MRPIETWHLQLKRVSKDIYIVCDTRKLQHFIFWIFHTRCLPLSLFLLYLIQGSRGTEQTSTRSAVRIQSPLILPLYLLLKVPKETPKTLKTASHIRSRIQVFFFLSLSERYSAQNYDSLLLEGEHKRRQKSLGFGAKCRDSSATCEEECSAVESLTHHTFGLDIEHTSCRNVNRQRRA